MSKLERNEDVYYYWITQSSNDNRPSAMWKIWMKSFRDQNVNTLRNIERNFKLVWILQHKLRTYARKQSSTKPLIRRDVSFKIQNRIHMIQKYSKKLAKPNVHRSASGIQQTVTFTYILFFEKIVNKIIKTLWIINTTLSFHDCSYAEQFLICFVASRKSFYSHFYTHTLTNLFFIHFIVRVSFFHVVYIGAQVRFTFIDVQPKHFSNKNA